DQRGIKDINIGPQGHAVFAIFDRMAKPAEDGRQVGEDERHRPPIALVGMANQTSGESAAAMILAHAIAAREVLGNVGLARIPEHDAHGAASNGKGVWLNHRRTWSPPCSTTRRAKKNWPLVADCAAEGAGQPPAEHPAKDRRRPSSRRRAP